MSLRKNLIMGIAMVAAVVMGSTAQAVENGVAKGATPEIASPGFTNFDPPSLFSQSLPLSGFYLNSKTKLKFLAGNGGVLNYNSNFGVSGFSAPNFLAFNCTTKNLDNTIPQLPMRIAFSSAVSSVSMMVGNSPGGIVTLAGYADTSSTILVATDSTTAQAALQTLTVARPGIRSVNLDSPFGAGRHGRRPQKRWRNGGFPLSPVASVRAWIPGSP
jgi:hypothetical protein